MKKKKVRYGAEGRGREWTVYKDDLVAEVGLAFDCVEGQGENVRTEGACLETRKGVRRTGKRVTLNGVCDGNGRRRQHPRCQT